MSSESKPVGQDIDSKIRTIDVEIDRNVSFEQLMLSPSIIAGLTRNNFIYPSPIQLKAIPLARCGKDLFVQAKSGTGKTLVFVVAILERALEKSFNGVQSLVVVPTREIALQIVSVIEAVAKNVQNFSVVPCIGGTEILKDRQKIANARCCVGTPGRVLHLIRNRTLNPETIKLVVLDEADKLLADSFSTDVREIMKSAVKREQTLIVTATLDQKAQNEFLVFMKNPLGVTPKKEAPILVGITQFIYQLPKMENVVEEMQKKLEALVKVLTAVDYNQCLIFTNSQSRAESFANGLHEKGFLAEFISGALDQNTRTKVFERIQQSPNCRIIVTTDLLARGIDAERVNLVVNMELPPDQFCYLHRIGRAGRFGSLGTAITFASVGEELLKFRSVLYDEEYPVFKVIPGEEDKLAKAIEDKNVEKVFEPLVKVNEKTEKSSQENVSEDISIKKDEKSSKVDDSSSKLKNIFNLYEDFILKGAKVDPETEEILSKVPKPVINTSNNIFLQKIVELNLYGDDEKIEPHKNLEDSPTKSDDSTKSIKDSSTTTDDLQESDINAELNDDNLNTESINDRVDAFLENLDNVSQDIPPSQGSVTSGKTYTVTQRGFDDGQSSSSSDTETNSTASNRGSPSYQYGIDDDSNSETEDEDDEDLEDEEEFFEATDHHPTQNSHKVHQSNSAMSFHSNRQAYNRWTAMYWSQASQIADYVNHWRFVQNQGY